MSEYWVSQGRRMCTYCKCWTADNKASINFHEQGKNHKENVKKKLDELRKKGIEEARKKENEISDLAKIEKAAMESFKKDVANNKNMSNAYGTVPPISTKTTTSSASSSDSPPSSSVKARKKSTKEKTSDTSQNISLPENWETAYTDEGYLYYWNSVTNETSWYSPGSDSQDTAANKSKSKSQASNEMVKSSKTQDLTTGYGQWETIAVEPTETVTDYDLPTDSKNIEVVPEDIPLPSAKEEPIVAENAEPKAKFKEKKVSLGETSKTNEPVAFKKPKMAKKRQARAAFDED
ncbi:WW domain-binding protein 4-like [Watersipora subatra]|uniref:WW domain-binding protein 4-like n=1 Tax=Watersipora subatra TaxID=2589382 RepID=UPI00355B65A2